MYVAEADMLIKIEQAMASTKTVTRTGRNGTPREFRMEGIYGQFLHKIYDEKGNPYRVPF